MTIKNLEVASLIPFDQEGSYSPAFIKKAKSYKKEKTVAKFTGKGSLMALIK
jgi:hypothetical protein